MSQPRKSRYPLVSLQQLFPQAVIAAGDDILVKSCSRRIRPHSSNNPVGHHVYVAGTDASSNAGDEAQAAVAKGATAILTDRLLPLSAPQCIVADVAASHAILCHELLDRPSTKMLTIGVIGSHGKTTAALYVASMMKNISGAVAYWTTLGATNHGKSETNKDETDTQCLTNWLARAAKADCAAAVIEISDTMLQSKSASALEFDLIVVPNLRENQRYDKQTTRFLENCTQNFCKQLKSHGMVIYNADDARLARWIKRNRILGLSYGLNAESHVSGRYSTNLEGETTVMVSAGRSLMPMETPRCEYIARHMLAAVAVGYAFGLDLHEIVGGVERLKKIPGRMQSVGSSRCEVVIDRADQADRLAVTMHSINATGRRAIVVAEIPISATEEQRAAFGRVLGKTASRVILTQSRLSLNLGQPLVWEVVDGCDRPAEIEIVPNRKTAIEIALRGASASDTVVLVGMGSETWTPPREKVAVRDDEVVMEIEHALSLEMSHAPVQAVGTNVRNHVPQLKIFNG